MHRDNLSSSTRHVIKLSELQKYEKGSQFSYFFEKYYPKLPRKIKFLSYYAEEEAPVEFVSKVEEYYLHFFYQATEIVVNCIPNRFQQKDHIETLEKMAILLLKVLCDEDFDHELQQMFSFFSSDLHKFKLKTKLKTLTHIVDEKQVAKKDAITVISSLNASQKLLVSEVLRLVKLILTVPVTIAVSERSCSTKHRLKF